MSSNTASEAPKALLVEDDRGAVEALSVLVEMEGFATATANSIARARQLLEKVEPDVILLDLNLPDGRGEDLLAEIEDDDPVEVILITGEASIDSAVQALRLGAFDYLTKPVDVGRLKTLLARVKKSRNLKEEVITLRSELRGLGRVGEIIGRSKAMSRCLDLVEKVAPTEASVLLYGESGTGKELAASTIHHRSPRRERAFVPVNCGAIPENLIESELFGHEKGAFTGATKSRAGHFENASGGTLFLDEITEMPPDAQVRLLRVLETGRIRRVGGRDEIDVDVRIIAATNRPPEQAVEENKLREDLYYRLNVFPITLPPLRDRGEDLILLAEHFLDRLNQHHEVRKHFSEKSLQMMREWHWPGNVRELKNVVERAFILAEETVKPDCLPIEISRGRGPSGPTVYVRMGDSLREAEKRVILMTLDELDGDKKQAAEILGVSSKTIYNRLREYEAEEEEAAASSEPENGS